MQISHLLGDLSAIAIAGAALGAVARMLRLPAIAGYVLAGFLIGPHAPFGISLVSSPDTIQSFADVGTVLLLFGVGLEMGFRKLLGLGVAPLFIGTFETLGVWYLGTLAANQLGFASGVSQFVGAALAFSSTAIVLTLLKEKSLGTAKFTETLVGILLVEDLLAILALVYLPAVAHGGSQKEFGTVLLHLGINLVAWWLAGTIVVPRVARSLHRTGGDEILLLGALGLCFGLAVLASSLGFSAALGAFVMGAILADARESRRIETLVRPVRHMFGLLFFVSFGMLFRPSILMERWETVLVFLGVIVGGKFLLPLAASLLAGKDLRDALRVSGSLGQIGEFSFVILQVGYSSGFLPPEVFPMVAAVSFATIFLTSASMSLMAPHAERLAHSAPGFLHRWHQSYVRALQTVSLRGLNLPQKRLQKTSDFIIWFLDIMRQNYREMTSGNTSTTLGRLAPWDEYLGELVIGTGSAIEGKSLIEINARIDFGVNIVAVARNEITRISPDPTLRLLPGDELLVYGTEPSIAAFAKACQTNPLTSTDLTLHDCDLLALRLEADHSFIGKSLRELRLREEKSCIVLALVRGDERIKNPTPDFTLQSGDEVFIVGPRTSLQTL